MSKSKFVIDKLAKLFEVGLISYKDLYSEILNKRIENLEKKFQKFEKKFHKKKTKRGTKL